jgi:hypothetical protein
VKQKILIADSNAMEGKGFWKSELEMMLAMRDDSRIK